MSSFQLWLSWVEEDGISQTVVTSVLIYTANQNVFEISVIREETSTPNRDFSVYYLLKNLKNS